MDAETSIAITSCRSTPTGSPAAGDRIAASAIAATTIRQPSAALPARFTSLPANDGELGPIEAFRLHPRAAFAGRVESPSGNDRYLRHAATSRVDVNGTLRIAAVGVAVTCVLCALFPRLMGQAACRAATPGVPRIWHPTGL